MKCSIDDKYLLCMRERERESTTFNFHVIGQRSFVPTQEHILDFCFPVSRAHHISVSQLLTYYFDYLHGALAVALKWSSRCYVTQLIPTRLLADLKGASKPPSPFIIDKNFKIFSLLLTTNMFGKL